jgi:hypothetical protein
VQGAQVIHANDDVSARLAGGDASASVTYNYFSDDDDPYQSGLSSAHEEPGNEDSVMAQPSIKNVDGGDIELSEALARQNATRRGNAQGNEVESECDSYNSSLFHEGSSAHEESDEEEGEIMEPICSPPACSESRQSTVDNRIIVAPHQAPPALSKYERFLMQDEGHECSICQIHYRLRDATLGSFCNPNTRNDDDAVCRHVFCYACMGEVRTKPNAMYPECPLCWVPGRVVHHEMVPYLGPHRANAIGNAAVDCSDFDPPLNDEKLRGPAKQQLFVKQHRCMQDL